MRKYNFKNEPLYPECMAQKEWNTNDIQDKVLNWKKLIMNNEDLHWFHDSSSEPLDPTNPRIQVTFDQLIGRKGFERRKVIFPTFSNQFLNEYIRISCGNICRDESILPAKWNFQKCRLLFTDPTKNYSTHGWLMGKLMQPFQMKL